jgi:thermitase
VVAIRAFDNNGFTSNYTLIRGIDHAIENGARVLSLSWGSETSSSLLESATRYAAAKGLILIAAAGNAPTGNPVYPAAYDQVIGVGALTPGRRGMGPVQLR